MVIAHAMGRALFLALFGVYLIAGVWTTRRVTATGDEVYYFMTADALVRGEGFDLTSRWAELSGASYAPGAPVPLPEFERSTAPSRVRTGNYPLHDLGLPLLIALPLALGGRPLVVVGVALAMAGAVALGHRLAIRLGARPAHATAGALAVGFSAPALTYSGQVFADAVAPLACALALCAATGAVSRRLFGPAIATLPVLHLRFWPLAIAIVVAYALLLRPSRRELATALVPLVVAMFVLALVDLAIYGVPVPHAGFLLFFLDRPAVQLATFTRPAGEGVLGLFVDRTFGLLPAAPIAALVFVGAGSALRSRMGAVVAAIAVPYVVLASLADWTGGANPQARFLAVLVPLFVVLLSLAFADPRVVPAAVALGVWTLGQSLVFVVAPWLRYGSYGVPPLSDTAWAGVVPVVPSRAFPLFGTDGATASLALVYVVLLIALAAFGRAFGRHEGVTDGADHGSV